MKVVLVVFFYLEIMEYFFIFVIMVYWFNLNFISIFCKLLDGFGFFISELFKDIYLKWVDELKIILMDFGF